MISLKEYAKKHNVSYEAVRKQVNRYREELGEHLYKVDRTQYLDEAGEDFLDQKRASNPVVIIEHDKDEQIEKLKQQNEALKAKVIQLQDILISRDTKVMELQDKLLLLTTKTEPEPETESKEDPEVEESPVVEQPAVQPVAQAVVPEKNQPEEPVIIEEPEGPKKKWWQFWK